MSDLQFTELTPKTKTQLRICALLKFVFVFLACCFLTVQLALSDETNLTLTVDGSIYSNVTFETKTPSTVSIRHSSGIASIPLEKLSPELQRRFGFDQQTAAEWRRQSKIQQIRAEKAALIKKYSATEFRIPFQVGMVGVFKNQVSIDKLVSRDEMVVRVQVWIEATASQMGDYAAAIRYSSAGQAEPKVLYPTSTCVIIKGIQTTDWVDGQNINLNSVFRITGSKTPKTLKEINVKSPDKLFVFEQVTPD